MTLSRPPPMRVTWGAAELLPPPEEDELSDPPQAVRPPARAATAAAAVRMRTVFIWESSFVVEWRGRDRLGGRAGTQADGTERDRRVFRYRHRWRWRWGAR